MAVKIYYNGSDVSSTTVEIPLGSTATFTGEPYSSTASIDRWFSSTNNDSIFTMTYSGSTCYVTPVAVGKASYPLYCWDSNSINGYIYIEVVSSSGGGSSSSTIYATSIVISPSTLSLEVGDTYTMSATVYPTNATDRTWHLASASGDEGVISTSSLSKVVTALGTGTATLYAIADGGEGSNFIYDTCAVTVTEATSSSKTVDHLSIRDAETDSSWYAINLESSMSTNETRTFEGRVWYSDDSYSYSACSWSVLSGSDLISYTTNTAGEINVTTSSSAGTVLLKCTATEDTSISHYVTITISASSSSTTTVSSIYITYSGSTYTGNFTVNTTVGSTLTFGASVRLSDGTTDSQGVIWSSVSGDPTIWSNNSSTTSSKSITITSAGTARIMLYSICDSYSTNRTITIVATESSSSTSTITDVWVLYNNDLYEDDFSITATVGDTLSFEGWAVLDGGPSTDSGGCVWSTTTSSSVLTKNSSSTGAATYTAVGVGTASFFVYAANATGSSSVSCKVTVTVVAASASSKYADCTAYIYKSGWKSTSAYSRISSAWKSSYVFAYPLKEKSEPTYTVSAVSGASYGFSLGSDGYYESTNQGVHSSYSICKVTINTPGGYEVIADCINYAESNYDYGILSTLGNTLSLSSDADSSNVKQSFKGSSMSSVQSVSYGTLSSGTYTFYVKFIKDSSQSSNNDSLKFKIRFAGSGSSSGGSSTSPTWNVMPISDVTYGFSLNSSGYYESQNAGVDSSYAMCGVLIENASGYHLYVDCINYAESSYDFGLLSALDADLFSLDNSIDSSNVQKSFSGSQSASVQTVDYGVLTSDSTYFWVKYRKDGSVNSNNDSLQFTVRLEA